MKSPFAGAVAIAFALAVGAIFAGGCKELPKIQPPSLGVSNGTGLEIDLFVNGRREAVFGPGQGINALERTLPDLPWRVEARTTSGRVIGAMTVDAGQVHRTALSDGTIESSGARIRTDLSCGRLDVWVGDRPLGPAPGPGQPGDCDP